MCSLTVFVPPSSIYTCQLCNGCDLHADGGGRRCFVISESRQLSGQGEEATKGGGVVGAGYKQLGLALYLIVPETPTNARRNHEEHTAEYVGHPDVGADCMR